MLPSVITVHFPWLSHHVTIGLPLSNYFFNCGNIETKLIILQELDEVGNIHTYKGYIITILIPYVYYKYCLFSYMYIIYNVCIDYSNNLALLGSE